MQFIEHCHSLHTLLTRSMKTRIVISPSDLKCALQFCSPVQNEQTKVHHFSRHAESYLNPPDHMDLKIMFILPPQLLFIQTPHRIVPITNIVRNRIRKLGMILNVYFYLLTISLSESERFLSRRTEKGKIIGLS